MNTETKEKQAGWVLYDGACPACRTLAARFAGWASRRGFETVPLQTPWVRERLGMDEAGLLAEMRVLTRAGKLYGGVDALAFLAGQTPWTRPLAWLGGTAWGRAGLDVLYRAFAARRYCLGGACRVKALPARKPWHRPLFAAAALYNLLWGIKTAADPAWFPRWAGMAGNGPFFRGLGGVVVLFGLMYVLLAVHPERHAWMAAAGLLGKFVGPAAQTALVLSGLWTAKTLWWTVPNDVFWWAPFGFYLRDAWRRTPAPPREALP